jgi:hypothetical protein
MLSCSTVVRQVLFSNNQVDSQNGQGKHRRTTKEAALDDLQGEAGSTDTFHILIIPADRADHRSILECGASCSQKANNSSRT